MLKNKKKMSVSFRKVPNLIRVEEMISPLPEISANLRKSKCLKVKIRVVIFPNLQSVISRKWYS